MAALNATLFTKEQYKRHAGDKKLQLFKMTTKHYSKKN